MAVLVIPHFCSAIVFLRTFRSSHECTRYVTQDILHRLTPPVMQSKFAIGEDEEDYLVQGLATLQGSPTKISLSVTTDKSKCFDLNTKEDRCIECQTRLVYFVLCDVLTRVSSFQCQAWASVQLVCGRGDGKKG